MRRQLLAAVLAALLFAPVGEAWTWPAGGAVLQPFSFDPAHPYAAGQHRGLDIGSDAGAAVLAPAAGSVTFAGTVPSSGKSVTITTADGYAVTLTHLGSITVARGAAVAEGAVVGTIGPSGDPELAQPYVHFGIRIAAQSQGYLDPLTFVPARVPAPAALVPPVAVEPPLAPLPLAAPAPAPLADPAPAAVPPAVEVPPVAVSAPVAEPAPVAGPVPAVASDPAPEPVTVALQPAQPPADQPPAERPPAEQPPAEQPPAEQPLAEQPLAEQPPAIPAPGTAPAPAAPAIVAPVVAEAVSSPPASPPGEPAAEDQTVPGAVDSPSPEATWPEATPPPERDDDATTADILRHGWSAAAPQSARDIGHSRVLEHRILFHRASESRVLEDRVLAARGRSRRVATDPAAAGARLRTRTRPVVRPRAVGRVLGTTAVLSAATGPRRAGVAVPALAVAALLAATLLAGALGAVRMMVRCGSETEEDPGRSGLAVCGGSPSPRSRGGLRRPVGRIRSLPPAEGQRRPYGERHGRARNPGDGGRRQGGQVLR